MSLREAFRAHKKAIFWSMALSASAHYGGIGSFYGQANFAKRFGVPAPASPNGYTIPAEWQSALSNGSSAGGILGLLFNGWAADRFGAKKVMLCSLICLTCSCESRLLILGFFFIYLTGVFQTLTTAYASEVCPIQLRGYLAAYVNLCWGVGILLSSGVVRATLTIPNDWSWRLPFIVQWVWIIPLCTIVIKAPTSPWWLVRQGRIEEAEANVRRLTSPDCISDQECKNTVAMMIHTTELERQVSEGTSYIDCFRKTDLRRTEIVMMVFAMQLLSGENLIGQGVQFLEDAGLGEIAAFDINMVLNSMFIIGTIFSWGLLSRFGRRTIYTGGMACMAVVLFIIGGIGFLESTEANRTVGSLLVVLNFVYNATLGPICYTLIAEVSSTRLRQKSIVLSRIAYQIMNIVCGIIVPRMLSVLAWDWGAKSGLFWGGSALLSTLYCLLRLPETRGRSYGELDMLFEEKVPAWRFSSTKADQFALADDVARTSDVKEDHDISKER
ncbi:maltose permease [Gymnopus androsaceus JB14]|uniref:Maltose permease n=1 Tax=Gymnopus androsaceus JB14 TaxID=1447944 RepID=A0A6A4H250_9AGAR|nr:maltose permease [Gymnopus androsaceus JB14]